ncbi:hypothetical protein CPT_Seuss98 [Caulobacter phage Seuss]|uniref:Uncharacterized protein n=1 Tax=Caulobacter phage Seuss TaxID=1675601 RepID=A0A0K1LMD0_9CAUD|nr:hypothetical protein HOR08_gp098 [Caulobacter phage Seuss]AKU43624.1 hypothetical protein CPT_Seuss98 [Caulobacter phage Seuss]
MPCQHRDLNKPTITGLGVPCCNPEVIPGWCVEHAPTHRCFFNLRSRSRCTAQALPGKSWCAEHIFLDEPRPEPKPAPDPPIVFEINEAASLDELKEVLARHFRGEL